MAKKTFLLSFPATQQLHSCPPGAGQTPLTRLPGPPRASGCLAPQPSATAQEANKEEA